jgi:hypothetical protein
MTRTCRTKPFNENDEQVLQVMDELSYEDVLKKKK